MIVRFLSGDWKTGLVADEIVKAINEFDGGPVYATTVDTGGADYLIALSDERLTPQQAYRLWAE